MVAIAILLWVVLALFVGSIANDKGHSWFAYTLMALFFSPLISYMYVAAIPADMDELNVRKIKAGTHKRCEHCREVIRIKAVTCSYCCKELVVGEAKG